MNDPEPPQHQPAQDHGTSRLGTARRLLHPVQIRDSLEFTRQPTLRNSALAGLQAAMTAAIALPLVYLSPWADLIGFAALGALVALFGRFAPERQRNRIVLHCALLQTLAVLVMSLIAFMGTPIEIQLVILAISCGVFFLASVSRGFGAPGALIFVFAAGASMDAASSLAGVFERTAATAIVAALAWAICAATEPLRHRATADMPAPDGTTRPLSQGLAAAGRIIVGAAVAVFVSHALGADHPAWAAMGSVAVMQGAHLHISMNRALQRMMGTVVGALLAWLLLTYAPSIWTLIAILVVMQFATELIIGANYGLGQILVTPMALLMSHLASPAATGAALALERVIDTALGASSGIILAIIFSTLKDRRDLAERHARRGP
ncbi:FUSC family protein [Pelagibacterium lacus]|uniref:FUSC family protein n=1 Tax=Pelagibacterium lacus TaxID=2282655 RepID=A0A369W770_9HYPH|nr:FUSC family protein [Pelagibacterium lacus]RDE10544.1 FUSC family protein [Pelagibacterium lacus]